MVRTEILALLVSAALLLLQPKTGADPDPNPVPPERPLCAAQFSLVSYACAALPYTPLPPPSPPAPPAPPALPDVSSHRHRYRHRHGHGGHHYHESPAEENCCRWLKELDDACVCDLLIRLPPFLSRPAHEYSVLVDESCNVTFSCGGLITP